MRPRAPACALLLALSPCSRPQPEARPRPSFGEEMHAVDDLQTDNVRDVTRKYRPFGVAVVETMAAAQKDPRPRVRANAVSILFDACWFAGRPDVALQHLLRALDDPEADVVSRAADALAGFYLDERGVRAAVEAHAPRLRAATSSPDPITQAHAVSALEKLGERPPAESVLRAQNGAIRRRGVAQALAAHDVAALPSLVELARRDPDRGVRLDAIAAVGELAAPPVRDPLLSSLFADPDDAIADAALRAAAASHATALAADVRRVAAAPECNRTDAALVALAALGDKEAMPLVATHLADRGSDAKWDAKLALDALTGETRSLPDWQAWARARGYLK